ncbi:Aa_trans domain-containing protein [Haematococcus lacustris]|uniref:Aa_trans domain-containing protein n=1 Tax=Haematococcus lacustris TaxID=44745 RepID=A0A699YKD5_HAELA|nr:Aa_trans domain-containing protein [Haematococcus lacustris]
MSSVWVWRRRMALALLVFGLVSGIACTDAILSAVKEEAVVVQLAQQLAAHEAVVVETTRAQTKAQEAVAAVSVVQTASAQLGLAQANASSSLGKLQRAADALHND